MAIPFCMFSKNSAIPSKTEPLDIDTGPAGAVLLVADELVRSLIPLLCLAQPKRVQGFGRDRTRERKREREKDRETEGDRGRRWWLQRSGLQLGLLLGAPACSLCPYGRTGARSHEQDIWCDRCDIEDAASCGPFTCFGAVMEPETNRLALTKQA